MLIYFTQIRNICFSGCHGYLDIDCVAGETLDDNAVAGVIVAVHRHGASHRRGRRPVVNDEVHWKWKFAGKINKIS